MKSFFKTVFATFFAILLFCTVLVLVCVGLAAALVRIGAKHEKKIESGSYLVFDMSVNITDTPPPSEGSQFLSKLFGRGDSEVVALRNVLDAIGTAAKDDRIAGIFLHGNLEPQGYGSGYAALREVREALTAFKAGGKPVVAYLVSPSTRDYYLACAASKVYINPFGEMEMAGLRSEPLFYADAFQKYGIGVQVTRVGKYKSFVEPFILDKMSPENREQTQKLLDDVWGQIKLGVQDSRSVPVARVQEVVDANGLIAADVAKQNGLVTDVAYLPDVLAELRKAAPAKIDTGEHTFRQIDLATYAKQKVAQPVASDSALDNLGDSSPKVAVVYAEGDIVDGEGQADSDVGGDRFARELRRLRDDKTVRAVVLRVNSPGGSALASEVIQHELVLLRDAGKPVVVSMGTVAASGGYWITTASDRVFAEPNTITGSIGVFGLLPNIQQLANDHGVTFDTVQTGRFADLDTLSRPKTPEELNVVQQLVDHIYDEFIARVSTSRKLAPDRVKEIAQGRVWSGEEALKIGLVDEIGGLRNALAYAKAKVKLPADAKIVEYPAPKELAEEIASLFSGENKPVTFLSRSSSPDPITRELVRLQADLQSLRRLNDPNGAYARLPFDLKMD